MTKEEKEAKISRRDFLKGAAVGATAVAGSVVISSCAPKVAETPAPAVESEAPAAAAPAGAPAAPSCGPSFLTPPAPIAAADIKSTVDGEIVVVGAGVCGLMAAYTAAKAGAKTIIIEKSETFNARGGHNAALRSKIQLAEGLDYDPKKVVRELTKWASNQVDVGQLMLWAENCSPIMDELIDMAAENNIEVMRWGNDVPNQYYPEYKTVHMFGGMDQKILAGMLEGAAKKAGADFHYSTPAAQLVKDDSGRVTGVIAKGPDGAYVQFNAAKAVILCTGDYGNDPEMVSYYCPKAAIVDVNVYTPPVNTGDGQKMGMWIGAAMQPEMPHTPMVHNLGAAPFSGNPFLRVNIEGLRYENEDVPIPSMANSAQLQPGHKTWTIYDASFEEDLPKMGVSFSRTNAVTDNTKKSMDAALDSGSLIKADTLDELAEKMGVPVDAFKATVARYNELAAKGSDDDFGKDAAMMTAIDTAPFYAAYNSLALLIALGGLDVNHKFQVLDKDHKVIPGLYAAGNCAGNFFANDYPVIVPGMSHSRAWTTGRLAAANALE
jgi:fumarate reductase flavoprotein subunit